MIHKFAVTSFDENRIQKINIEPYEDRYYSIITEIYNKYAAACD